MSMSVSVSAPESGPAATGHPLIIDGHAHCAGEFCRAEDIIRVMDELGVAAVVLCPGPVSSPRRPPVPDLTRVLKKRGTGMGGNWFVRLLGRLARRRIDFDSANAEVAEFARRYPGRIIPAFWADPSVGGLKALLEARHGELGFRAVKLHQCFQRFTCDSAGMREIADFAAAERMPVIIHLYGRRDARALVRLAMAFPRTNIVVAHLLGLDIFIRAGRAAVPNVYLDISPPNLTSPWLVRRAVEAFGADHVLLGSDTPYGRENLRLAIARVDAMDIPPADKALILGGNAARLYGVSVGYL
jgi:predicted TIM-barrel fold metal-dependent hydrolase